MNRIEFSDALSLFVIFVLLLMLASMMLGCTRIAYRPDGSITYLSLMQRKSLVLERDAAGVRRVEYNTDSNAVVELARSVESLAKTIAGTVEKP